MTAGRKFAAAVPDVQVMTAGSPVALAMPSAKNAAARSSTCECTVSRPSRTSASTSGVEREPGDVHACRTPLRTSSSANARSRTWVSRSEALIGDAVGVTETVVLLHGFAGTGRLWDPVVARLDGERYRPLAPDLRGHGTAATRRPVSFEACVEDVLGLVAHPFTLAGYSMGGRIALQAALAAPERVDRLVLVATTAGIEDPAERERRRAGDEALADADRARDDRRLRRALDGAAAVRRHAAGGRGARGTPTCSTTIRPRSPRRCAGSGRARWSRSGTGCRELRMPATVVAGERDAKFVALGQRLADELPNGELVIVEGAGHGIPREDPAAVAAAIAG